MRYLLLGVILSSCSITFGMFRERHHITHTILLQTNYNPYYLEQWLKSTAKDDDFAHAPETRYLVGSIARYSCDQNTSQKIFTLVTREAISNGDRTYGERSALLKELSKRPDLPIEDKQCALWLCRQCYSFDPETVANAHAGNSLNLDYLIAQAMLEKNEPFATQLVQRLLAYQLPLHGEYDQKSHFLNAIADNKVGITKIFASHPTYSPIIPTTHVRMIVPQIAQKGNSELFKEVIPLIVKPETPSVLTRESWDTLNKALLLACYRQSLKKGTVESQQEENERIAIAKTSLDAGADINAIHQKTKRTPLIIATINNWPRLVTFLAQHGADKTIVDKQQFRAYDWARLNRLKNIQEILEGTQKEKIA